MIKFPCLCGEVFTLPDEMAGEMFQCKKCSRLVAVPTLDDLQNIQEDGTYDIGGVAEAPKRVDRAPVMGTEEANATVARTEDSNPYDFEEPAQTNAPRYDPFTGELIRAHEVIVTEDSEVVKNPRAPQPLSKMYDRGMVTQPPKIAWLQLFGEMFMTHNIVVMVLMYLLNLVLVAISGFVVGIGFFFAFAIPVLIGAICVGYYSIIVQETGPGDRDSLPTPVRDFDFRTDMWEPTLYMSVTIFVCLGPAYSIGKQYDQMPGAKWMGMALLGLGMIVMPAFMLTASVGGIVANFRPDRLLSVMFQGGLEYLIVVITWIAGMALLADGSFGIYVWFVSLFGRVHGGEHPWFQLAAGPSAGMMAAGLYLTYYSCWLLGLVWRRHYENFPWVGQRNIRAPVALPPPRPVKAPTAPKEGPTIV